MCVCPEATVVIIMQQRDDYCRLRPHLDASKKTLNFPTYNTGTVCCRTCCCPLWRPSREWRPDPSRPGWENILKHTMAVWSTWVFYTAHACSQRNHQVLGLCRVQTESLSPYLWDPSGSGSRGWSWWLRWTGSGIRSAETRLGHSPSLEDVAAQKNTLL